MQRLDTVFPPTPHNTTTETAATEAFTTRRSTTKTTSCFLFYSRDVLPSSTHILQRLVCLGCPDCLHIKQREKMGSERVQSSAESGRELSFGKKLAAHDKPTRDKAVKRLSKWLKRQDTLSDLDNRKLWKALFYCMWHSDKLLVQEELATFLVGYCAFFVV